MSHMPNVWSHQKNVFMYEERRVLHGKNDSHTRNRKHALSLRFF